MKIRSWSDENLKDAVDTSRSIRGVLIKLKLVPAGGNYDAVQKRIKDLSINTDHFAGKGWRTGSKKPVTMAKDLVSLLKRDSMVQSYKLKKRLFLVGLKKPFCEECGWATISKDGRLPLELDHINGIKSDNRLCNLRILCPNCHSLKPTHRGKNKKSSGGEMVYT